MQISYSDEVLLEVVLRAHVQTKLSFLCKGLNIPHSDCCSTMSLYICAIRHTGVIHRIRHDLGAIVADSKVCDGVRVSSQCVLYTELSQIPNLNQYVKERQWNYPHYLNGIVKATRNNLVVLRECYSGDLCGCISRLKLTRASSQSMCTWNLFSRL